MEFKDRLKELIDKKELTPYRIGVDTSVKKQSVMNYLTGKTVPNGDALKELSNYLKVSIDYLMDNEVSYITHIENSLDGLPVIPFDAVAGWNSIDSPGVSLDNLDRYVVPEFTSKGAEFIIRVSGSSMYPKYSNGDLLACRKVHEILFFQWGKIYVIDSSQGAMIKRIYEDLNNPDMIICHSDNTDHYPRFSIPKTDIRSLSIVLGVIRME